MLNIKFVKTENYMNKPDPDNLVFGTVFTDYMFTMDYIEGKGWIDPRIEPFQEFLISPAAMVFHYGQEMFEGLKAYKTEGGDIQLFRPDMNAKRARMSNRRLCIPEIDEEDFIQAVKAVVAANKDWVPDKEGTTLYIRPFVIAMDPFLGVRPAFHYRFMIICSPVGAYYPEGINPVKIFIEDEYVRAVKGGIGEAKTGGNYVASLASQVKAHDMGYSQVLWLDGVHRKYIEEVGAMNIFFNIDGTLMTPELTGSILHGVTRDSVLELLRMWNIPTCERRISIDEIYEAYLSGKLLEVFGTGTAAVISPVGRLLWGDKDMVVNNERIGELSQKIYDTLTGIQSGKVEGPKGWLVKVNA